MRICLGHLRGGDGDDDRAVFVGGSTPGAIEPAGDDVATAAMYATG